MRHFLEAHGLQRLLALLADNNGLSSLHVNAANGKRQIITKATAEDISRDVKGHAKADDCDTRRHSATFDYYVQPVSASLANTNGLTPLHVKAGMPNVSY